MKKIILAVLVVWAHNLDAATYTLVAGTYESQAPALVNGDVLNIPAGITVTTSSVLSLPNITMNILGTFTFLNVSPKPKWTLGTGSIINVYNQGVINNNSSSPAIQLTIGSNVVYNGGNPPVTGPATASSSSAGFTTNTALPLRFLQLSAMAGKGLVDLKWSAINDESGYRFIIQRSKKGAEWTTLSTVMAEQQPGRVVDYTHTDIVRGTGTFLYRIGIAGTGGGVQYSQVASVVMNDASGTRVGVKDGKIEV